MKNKVLVVLSILLMAATSFAGTLSITNPGVRNRTRPLWSVRRVGPSRRAVPIGSPRLRVAPDSAVDPDVAAEGDNWLSGNRLATGAGSSNNPQKNYTVDRYLCGRDAD